MTGGSATGSRRHQPAPASAASTAPERSMRVGESDVSSKRLLRNTVANGFGYIGNALITVAITPFLLHRLGVEQYGLSYLR